MQIVRSLGGYTLGRSDLVRRAMSKKKASVMEKNARISCTETKKREFRGVFIVESVKKQQIKFMMT